MDLQCGFRLDNAEVIANPWLGDTSVPVPWPVGEPARLACVGRLDPRAKGQDILLQLMAMPKWRSRSVQLRLYGGGPCAKTLNRLKEWWDLGNVEFAGHVADVRMIWAACHALVLPSRFEGLPLVIVEAMLCGRPVITTDVGGNAQYIRDGVTGFVAAAPTVHLFDEALERAWGRRAEWSAIGKDARRALLEALPPDPTALFADRLNELIG